MRGNVAALYNFKWLYLFLYDNESPFFFLPLKTPIWKKKNTKINQTVFL